MSAAGRKLRWALGLLVAGGLILEARAQAPASDQPTNYSAGKTAEQLFKSDCSTCHKSARGLAKSQGLVLESFMRKHYTNSRETAALLAGYIATQIEPPKPAPPVQPVRQASPRPEPSAPSPPSLPSFFSIFGAEPDKEKEKPAAKPPKPRRAAKPADGARPAGEASRPSGDKAKSDAAAKEAEPPKDGDKDGDKAKQSGEAKDGEKPKPASAVESTGRSATGEGTKSEAKAEKTGDGGTPSIAAPEKAEQKPSQPKSN